MQHPNQPDRHPGSPLVSQPDRYQPDSVVHERSSRCRDNFWFVTTLFPLERELLPTDCSSVANLLSP